MRADRLLALMLMLQAKGRMSAQDLAGQLEVSERTIYRDIDALSLAGVPVYTRPGTNGGVFLDENYRISLTGLSKSEIQALFISGAVGPLEDLGLGKAVEDMLLKLFAALPSIHRREVERVRQRIHIDTAYWFQLSEPLPHFALLQQAVWENRRVKFDYRHHDGTLTPRFVDAYGLVAKANIWYLVGKSKNGAMRSYRVVRMQNFGLTGDIFERNPDFDLAAHWQESCRAFEGEISESFTPCVAVARVKPEAVWYFENFMMGRYELLLPPQPDEWLTLRVQFYSFGDAKTRILSLGSDIQVLEPPELHEAIVATAKAIIDLHMEPTEQSLASQVDNGMHYAELWSRIP